MHQLQHPAPHPHQHHQHESPPNDPPQPHYHHGHGHAHHDTASISTSMSSRKHRGHHGHGHGHSHSHGPSPYHSRHASPHSHHSHSLHSSPHQSHGHVHGRGHVDDHDDDDGTGTVTATNTITNTNTNSSPHAPSSSSAPHHHHHHRRRRRSSHHQAGSAAASTATTTRHHQHGSGCSRRHRSTTDVSSTSINTCHEPLCADREVQEILVRKSCCSSNSRTELAQYFAEDLYGSSSRRPSSCCTSSDYCYHTDSTSLYGSRSSLSRNNSIKSASGAVSRRRRLHQRQPSYTSISLRGLNASGPNSQLGSLTSIFDRAKQLAEQHLASDEVGDHGATTEGPGRVVVSPSKVTIERRSSSSSRDALNQELPEYACSPSPIRWSFLADGKSPTEFEGAVGGGHDHGHGHGKGNGHRHGDGDATQDDGDDDDEEEEAVQNREPKRDRGRDRYRRSVDAPQTPSQAYAKRKFSYEHERPTTSSASSRKCRGRESPFSCDFEESTTVLFHQEAEAFNNCCSNYIQCNSYLDQDLQITSEDIHQYLSKGSHGRAGDVLNNSKNYPFQPSNALEFQYKNNFANNNNATPPLDHGACSGEGLGGCGGGDGARARGYDAPGRYRRNSSKETNLNQNSAGGGGVGGDSSYAGVAGGGGCPPGCSPANINLSSSTNNINIVFSSCSGEAGNANEVKFINTTRENLVSAEGHHAGYLPYTYPSYDYTNMSANSFFDKPLGIDAIPSGPGCGSPETDGQYSSSLQSPVQPADVGLGIGVGVDSFDSFDAASDNNLLSQRSSCQFSPRSPLSPRSPGSPATTSSISATIDPSSGAYGRRSSCCQQQGGAASVSHHGHRHQQHHNHHQHNHQHPHHGEGSKLSSALRRVRKRARNFLRKK